MILLSAIAAAILFWWVLKAALRADPARLSRLLKQVGGVAALGVAGVLVLRGRFDMAVLVGGAGVALIGSVGKAWPFKLSWPAPRSSGLARARSATLEIEFDRRSGRMRGTVLAGPMAGRELDGLSTAELGRFADLCRQADRDGFALLQSYLDRRFPGRREDAERDPDTRPRSEFQGGAMTPQEAYEVLGLQPGAAEPAVRQAHRQLMKKLHPDGGGSTYLASRVNQAKDVLLNRHR